jgi:hypothetical protein
MPTGSAEATALSAAVRAGNEVAFNHLATRHPRELLIHCYRMLGSLGDADDAVQDAFLRAWRYRSPNSGRLWAARACSVRCKARCCWTFGGDAVPGYDAETLHPGNQGCSGQSQLCGRPVPAADHPVRRIQGREDVVPLHFG